MTLMLAQAEKSALHCAKEGEKQGELIMIEFTSNKWNHEVDISLLLLNILNFYSMRKIVNAIRSLNEELLQPMLSFSKLGSQDFKVRFEKILLFD